MLPVMKIVARAFCIKVYREDCVFITEATGSLMPTDHCPWAVFGVVGAQADAINFDGVGPCAAIAK